MTENGRTEGISHGILVMGIMPRVMDTKPNAAPGFDSSYFNEGILVLPGRQRAFKQKQRVGAAYAG
jgi:hypothetical protein